MNEASAAEGRQSVPFGSASRLGGVVLGFASLLLLMGVMALDSANQMRDINLDSAQLRRQYRERSIVWDEMRADIYHAGTMVKEYLIQPRRGDALKLTSTLADLKLHTNDLLRRYEGQIPASERQSLSVLHQRLNDYWRTLESALLPNQPHSTADTVLPRRDDVLEIMRHINALDENDTIAGEDRIQALHSQFQNRVERMSLLSLAFSAVLAVVVVLRQRSLERVSVAHFQEVLAARRDLQSLSDRLVSAQEQERRNVARELHDQVGQSMTAVLMDVARLESRLPAGEHYRGILKSIRESVEENVARVRDLSLLLRPSMLDELGLVPALQWQAREVSRRTGLKVKMLVDEFDEDLSDDHRTCIYRVVQEALHNCVKHAHASEVRVVINRNEEGLMVSVQDNGTGFDPAQQKGLGLLGIEERVRRFGGNFCVTSRPGGGAVLSLQIPISAAAMRMVKAGTA